MSQMLALVLILGILYIGDAVSARTKAWIPSVFICALLFLLGYWTIFPKDIVSIAGIPPVVAVMLMYLLITNMGTLLSLRELLNQWKTVLISLAGILGVMVFACIIGMIAFDRNTILVAVPPLVGGVVSLLIMSKGAAAAGLTDLSIFAILLYVMGGFAGYPLTAIMLQREGKRVLQKYRAEGHAGVDVHVQGQHGDGLLSAEQDDMPKLFSKMPSQYNTHYFKFLRLAIVSFLAYQVSTWLAPLVSVSPFVICLLFGVISVSAGFLERHVLQKANGFGFAVMALMLFIFDTLNQATPEMLMRLFFPMFTFIIGGVIGMFIFSWIAGKMLHVSTEMAFAISLTAFYGFPADYIITNEAINALTHDEQERQFLTRHMLGSMLVGGFVSVTIVSVVLAGSLVTYLTPVAG